LKTSVKQDRYFCFNHIQSVWSVDWTVC